jgi:putative ABC transport system ATP-binding protein
MNDLPNPVVRVENLSKLFQTDTIAQRRAVDDVSFSVEEGKFVLIKGPSGSGKTTLLSMIGCLMRPTSGSISIRSADVLGMTPKKLAEFRLKHIGFIFQKFRLVDYLTVFENVLLPLTLNQIRRELAIERANKLLSEVGLSNRSRSVVKELSGGEQQRVAVARALANEPFLILADEPTGSLDSAAGRSVIQLLSELTERKETTVVVVSHDDRIVPHADKLLVIEDGRLAEASTRAYK